jgi:uncharacterized glyoxalase superfamily protein PhnB
MAEKAKPVPEGFHTVTPHLVVRGAEKALDFYKRAFGAQIRSVHKTPDGKVMHADMRIGDSILMLNDEFPEMKANSPQALGGSSVTLNLYVPDADAVFKQAVGAGATVAMPIADMFWGDRYGQVVDPFGHRWAIATHKEDLSEAELEKRGKDAMAEMAKQHSSR